MKSAASKSPKLSFDHRQVDPARPVDWRWRAAKAHLSKRTIPEDWEDSGIAQLVAYLHELKDAHTAKQMMALHKRYPDVSQGHRLFAEVGRLRDEVEARLLCEHIQDVATKTGLSIDVLFAYTSMFFDVLDCLSATDWLMSNVVRLYDRHQHGLTEGDVWKYWAVAGGPQVLELLIADSRGGLSEPRIANRHLLAEKGRFLVREFVTPSRDRAAMAAIIEEGCDRFGELWGCEPADRYERQALQMHMRTLRVAYGLSPKPRKFAQSVKHPKNKKSKQPHSTESRK